MKARELRTLARESLQGKWGKGALLTLVYLIAVYAISFVLGLIPFIGQIASIIISPAFTFGFLVSLVKLSRGENPTYFEFLNNGLNVLGKLWKITFRVIGKIILPLVLVFVSAIIMGIAIASEGILLFFGFILYIVAVIYMITKLLLYSLTSYILVDESFLTAKEIVEKSESLMKGNRWNIFWLELSFIGWAILSILTLGIGYFWLLPYMQISFIKFYEILASSKNTNTETDYDNLV